MSTSTCSGCKQLDQLVAGTAVTLTDEEARLVEECYRPHPVLGIE